MNNNRSQWIIFWVITGVLSFFALVVIFAAMDYAVPEPEKPAQDWRPDLSKCPDDVELWECVKGAMYRRDI